MGVGVDVSANLWVGVDPFGEALHGGRVVDVGPGCLEGATGVQMVSLAVCRHSACLAQSSISAYAASNGRRLGMVCGISTTVTSGCLYFSATIRGSRSVTPMMYPALMRS